MTPDILKAIVEEKWREVEQRQKSVSLDVMRQDAIKAGPTRGFRRSLETNIALQRPAVIAEIKKASPSKGIIRENFNPIEIAKSYEDAGASCLSILTDVSFFQGSDEYLVDARAAVNLPVLRKDFVVDEYQVYEARALGADCILLIVGILSDESLNYLHQLAMKLSMNVLVEVHDTEELQRALKIQPDILGINNRNLRTFDVSLETTFELMQSVEENTLLVTESGIHTKLDVQAMLNVDIYAFLVGESFMRAESPGDKLKALFF